MRSQRVLDDQAFFDRFPMPGLCHPPLASGGQAAMDGSKIFDGSSGR